MGDITWTRWSQLQQLNVTRSTANHLRSRRFNTRTILPFRWEDTYRFSIGGNYKWNEQAKVRMGIAYIKTPSQNATRTPRLPDQDRTWLAAGVQYRVSKSGVFDFGYAHEFIRDASVNVSVPPAGTLNGKFSNQADILSVQYSHTF